MHDEPIQDDIIKILCEHGIPMRDGRIRVKDLSKALRAIGVDPTVGIKQSIIGSSYTPGQDPQITGQLKLDLRDPDEQSVTII